MCSQLWLAVRSSQAATDGFGHGKDSSGMAAKKRILVVEDDVPVLRGMVELLNQAGFLCSEATNVERAMLLVRDGEHDLLLLDLILPDGDGLDILSEVRRMQTALPVVIITARGEEEERVRGLQLGADDYIVKPFGWRELLARVEAVLRRAPERPAEVDFVPLAEGVANLARREVQFRDGARATLTEREAQVLAYLARNPRRVISREELLSRVWGLWPRGIETRTIDMHIARLREKIRDQTAESSIIGTVHGKGYVFCGTDAE
jgi:DNA-binding response OmpR family regulator